MKYYIFEPEVSGQFGKHTIYYDEDARPPVVTKLHFVVDTYGGADIICTFGVFLATVRLADRLVADGYTGFFFDNVEVAVSEIYTAFYGNKLLPEFRWLKLTGKAGEDDLALHKETLNLVGSEKLLTLLKQFSGDRFLFLYQQIQEYS